MDFIFYFIFFIFLFTVQISLLGFVAIRGVVPDLALIFAFYCGTRFTVNRAVFMAGLNGFIQDCLSARVLGINTLSKSLIGFFVVSLKEKISVEGVVPIFVFLAIASFVDGIIFYIVSLMLMEEVINKGFFLNSLPVYAFYNGLVGPLIFTILNLYQKRNQKELDFQIPGT